MSQLQYASRGILEFTNTNVRASIIGRTPLFHATFKVNRYFNENFPLGFKSVIVLNCFGSVKICDFDAGKLDSPTFFKCYSYIPEFLVQLTPEIITIIEEKRQERDVYVSFLLKVLCAFDNEEAFSNPRLVFETDLNLSATIPKSRWLEEFLPTWDYFNANEIIISLANLNFSTSIKRHIAEARRAFSSNSYRESLASVYRALEALHKNFGYEQFGVMLEVYKKKGIDSKHKKVASMFQQILEFLNYARHDQTKLSATEETKEFTREDAKIALIYGQMIIDYVLNNPDYFKE